MEIKPVSLVLADISGYTKFIQEHRNALLHAEQIVTELLEAIVDTAEYPLRLNKLEGDAVLLYTPVKGQDVAVAKDVAEQTLRFFQAFYRKQFNLIDAGEGGCACIACTNIHQLKIKIIAHQGEAVVKRFRQFEELAGEDVILIHRLLKNSLAAREYLMMTEHFHRLSGGLQGLKAEVHTEEYEGIGEIKTTVFYPTIAMPPPVLSEIPRMSLSSGKRESMRLQFKSMLRRLFKGGRQFRNLTG
ncbi:DUF2652 domain-containing protein [Chloroflexota bacterium]